jgi:hypothetical protein
MFGYRGLGLFHRVTPERHARWGRPERAIDRSLRARASQIIGPPGRRGRAAAGTGGVDRAVVTLMRITGGLMRTL